jgi:hypothetical protein
MESFMESWWQNVSKYAVNWIQRNQPGMAVKSLFRPKTIDLTGANGGNRESKQSDRLKAELQTSKAFAILAAVQRP